MLVEYIYENRRVFGSLGYKLWKGRLVKSLPRLVQRYFHTCFDLYTPFHGIPGGLKASRTHMTPEKHLVHYVTRFGRGTNQIFTPPPHAHYIGIFPLDLTSPLFLMMLLEL